MDPNLKFHKRVWAAVSSSSGQTALIVAFCVTAAALVAAVMPDFTRYAMVDGYWAGLWTQPFTLVVLACCAVFYSAISFYQTPSADRSITQTHLGILTRTVAVLHLIAAMVVSVAAWQHEWWKPIPGSGYFWDTYLRYNYMIYASCNIVLRVGYNCDIPILKRLSVLETSAIVCLDVTIALTLFDLIAYTRRAITLGQIAIPQVRKVAAIEHSGIRESTDYCVDNDVKVADHKAGDCKVKELYV